MPAGDKYYYQNSDIFNSSPDPNSSNMIDLAWTKGDTGGLDAEPGHEFVNQATATTPLVTVSPNSTYHSFPSPYPWDGASFKIENLGPGTDDHAMIVNQNCREFESDETSWDGTELHAYSGAIWALNNPFQPLPGNSPSALSSGTSEYLGLAQYSDEVYNHFHTLNMALPILAMCKEMYTHPADDTADAGNLNTADCIPWGAHLFLSLGTGTHQFNPALCNGDVDGTFLAYSMSGYGVIAADDTGAGVNNQELYLDNGPWNTTDLGCLSTINIKDFYVATLGTVVTK